MLADALPTPPVSDMLSWIVASLLLSCIGLVFYIFKSLLPAKEAQISKLIADDTARFDALIEAHAKQIETERKEASIERNLLYDRFSETLKGVQDTGTAQIKMMREEIATVRATMEALTQAIVQLRGTTK